MPRNLSDLNAVIFDVDGTLIDSNDLHIEAWREAFAHHGVSLDRDEIHTQIGKGGDQLIPVFCSKEDAAKFGPELEKLRAEIFARDYLPQVRPFPKVRELFERLRGDGLQIALATSSKQSELESYMKILDVEPLVVATSADDADHSKPCPDIFQAALALLDEVSADEAIVVGDTPYDSIAAERAGLASIGLLSGGFGEEVLRNAGAIDVYMDVADLLEHYGEWTRRRRWTDMPAIGASAREKPARASRRTL